VPIVPRACLLSLLTWLFAASTPAAAPAAHYRLAVWPNNLPTPDFALRDGTGAHRSVRDYRGQILLVFFGFVQCPDACPIELLKLSQVMQQLGPLSDRVRLVFITLDPKHDTPAGLKQYLANFDSRFIGLTGTVAQVDDAAKQFAVNYAPIARGAGYTIDHSTATFVLDPRGTLRLVGGKESTIEDFVHDLKSLSSESAAPRAVGPRSAAPQPAKIS
jgi:protein SCO1